MDTATNFAHGLFMWASHTQLDPASPFCSYVAPSGTRFVLASKDINLAIKSCAVALGYDASRFATHSLRIGGALSSPTEVQITRRSWGSRVGLRILPVWAIRP